MTRSSSELDNEKVTRIAMTSPNSSHPAIATLDLERICLFRVLDCRVVVT